MYMRMPVETTAIRVDGEDDTGFSAEREGGALTEVACWAHARRKIHDVYISSISAAAEEGLKRISELYAIENEIRGLPESERLAVRQRRSKWGPLGKRKISHAKTIFYTVTVCCFALTLRIVCRVVRNSLAIALILAPDLMRSSTFCVCSSFNTGGRPKRFPASRALAIPE